MPKEFAELGLYPSPPFAESLPQRLCFGPEKKFFAELVGNSSCKKYFWLKTFGGFGGYPPFFLGKIRKIVFERLSFSASQNAQMHLQKDVVFLQLQKNVKNSNCCASACTEKEGVVLASQEKNVSPKKSRRTFRLATSKDSWPFQIKKVCETAEN